MGEIEAINTIKAGKVTLENINFKIVKQEHGWCDGCFYESNKLVHNCPDLARKICCTGGNILIEDKEDGRI